MNKFNFDFFDDSGQPRSSRILMFYSFETDEHLARSGILHYHLGEQRFVARATIASLPRRPSPSCAERPPDGRDEQLSGSQPRPTIPTAHGALPCRLACRSEARGKIFFRRHRTRTTQEALT